jgi:predicted CXXCH cytochrome family protein
LKLKCATCHTTAEKAERAGFPTVTVCAGCHVDGPTAEALREGAKFPAKRVYRLPDFVVFSHARHVAAKVECQTCHGEVAAQAALVKTIPSTTMKFCVDCHKAKTATVVCTSCHDLGQ